MCFLKQYSGYCSSRESIYLSLLTFAIIEAAAIDALKESPLIIAFDGTGRPGRRFPSTNAACGRSGRASKARRMARKVALRIFISSISSTLALATA